MGRVTQIVKKMRVAGDRVGDGNRARFGEKFFRGSIHGDKMICNKLLIDFLWIEQWREVMYWR